MSQANTVVGVGPGRGAAVARRFAKAGHPVELAARNADKLGAFVSECEAAGSGAKAYACDATTETDGAALFEQAEVDLGPVGIAVYNASGRARKPIVETTVEEFGRPPGRRLSATRGTASKRAVAATLGSGMRCTAISMSLGLWLVGCDAGFVAEGPRSACNEAGAQCVLSQGVLGVCERTPCNSEATPPCFVCTSQH